MNQTPHQSTQHHEDEIDLFELWQTIWSLKWLVIGVTLFAMLSAASYSYFATKTYSAEVVILPPSSQDVQVLKFIQAKTDTEEVKDIYPANGQQVYVPFEKQVYQEFVNELLSIEQQKKFLVESSLFLGEGGGLNVFNYFSQRLKYEPTAKNSQREAATIKFSSSQPEMAASVLNDFVRFSVKKVKARLVDEATLKVALQIQLLGQEIDFISKDAKLQGMQRVEALQEALEIAQKVGFKEVSKTQQILINSTEYFKGTELLLAEIEVLKKRTNDSAFIEEISDLRKELAFLESISINVDDIKPVRVDQYASVPTSADKPKVSLIMAVSVVLGGMLGVFIALIRGAVLKRRQPELV